jgi:hypothetical protein
MIKRILIGMFLVLTLAGAKCTKEIDPNKVEIDPSLLVRCPELPVVDPQAMPMGTLMLEYSKLQGQYIECAVRNDCLIEAATADGTVRITCPALDKLKTEKNKND